MRIARVLVRSKSRPRVALERDGVLYDVEELEAALGAAVPVPGDAWDFHTRVAVLGTAGLRELDAQLLQGKRPASARLGERSAPLPPCDTDRAVYVQVDPRGPQPAVRIGHARAIAGQDALVDLPRGETSPGFEIGIGVLVGDDLRDATRAEARSAVVGYAILLDWCARDAERAAPAALATVKGLRAQLGPVLVAAGALTKPESLAVRVDVGGAVHEVGSVADLGLGLDEAVAFASSRVELAGGDVVGVGPFPRGVSEALGIRLAFHVPVAATVERVGTLRGTAVPRR